MFVLKLISIFQKASQLPPKSKPPPPPLQPLLYPANYNFLKISTTTTKTHTHNTQQTSIINKRQISYKLFRLIAKF